jgi:hypothetical protein
MRGNEVHQAFLGTVPVYARLPVPSSLIAMLSIGQLPQLSASYGIGDDLQRFLERLPGLIG